MKGKGEIHLSEDRVPKKSKEREESLLKQTKQKKKKRKTREQERLETSTKLEIPTEYFMQRWAQ